MGPDEIFLNFKKNIHNMFIKAMNEIIADIIVKLKHISSGPIYIDVPTITSEHPSSESNFEVKLQAKIYPCNQSSEKKRGIDRFQR